MSAHWSLLYELLWDTIVAKVKWLNGSGPLSYLHKSGRTYVQTLEPQKKFFAMTGANRKFLCVLWGWVKLSLSMTGCFCGHLKPPRALGLVVAGWATCYTTAPAALNGIDFGLTLVFENPGGCRAFVSNSRGHEPGGQPGI